MPEFERSETIDASPAHTYEFLADIHNLPKYVATMVMARPESANRLHVAAEVAGRHEEGDARFKSDSSRRRLEWGGTAGGYSGWLQVVPAGDDHRSTVTIHLTTSTDDESDEVQQALVETLHNIKRELGA
jgi:uncharacterized membrane protein